jgi:hypothetical protein
MRRPRVLRKIGPFSRPSIAWSMARATAGGSGTKDDFAAFAAHA